MTRFVTTHILTPLPLHNVNRDQNGMPKSTIDGDVQRARLSSQSLKRAARVAYRQHADTVGSLRTRNATTAITASAAEYARRNGIPLDEKSTKAIETKAKSLVKSLTDSEAKKGDAEKKATILFFSRAEIDTVAGAIVDSLTTGADVKLDQFIRDSSSPSLDVAAFGRMFAKEMGLSTLAAVAVSHAVTTHEMTLTSDYFSAVEDGEQEHAGGAHLGMAYFTSGTYYRSFTIDVDQLARSWSNFHAESAPDQVAALVKALIVALPRGRASNSAPNVLPHTVLVETQKVRTGYGFDEPVLAGDDGGLADQSAHRLAAERKSALRFDGDLFGPAKVYTRAEGIEFNADQVGSLDELIQFIVDTVYEDRT